MNTTIYVTGDTMSNSQLQQVKDFYRKSFYEGGILSIFEEQKKEETPGLSPKVKKLMEDLFELVKPALKEDVSGFKDYKDLPFSDDINKQLFDKHYHVGEITNEDEIVYKEEDVISLLSLMKMKLNKEWKEIIIRNKTVTFPNPESEKRKRKTIEKWLQAPMVCISIEEIDGKRYAGHYVDGVFVPYTKEEFNDLFKK